LAPKSSAIERHDVGGYRGDVWGGEVGKRKRVIGVEIIIRGMARRVRVRVTG